MVIGMAGKFGTIKYIFYLNISENEHLMGFNGGLWFNNTNIIYYKIYMFDFDDYFYTNKEID